MQTPLRSAAPLSFKFFTLPIRVLLLCLFLSALLTFYQTPPIYNRLSGQNTLFYSRTKSSAQNQTLCFMSFRHLPKSKTGSRFIRAAGKPLFSLFT